MAFVKSRANWNFFSFSFFTAKTQSSQFWKKIVMIFANGLWRHGLKESGKIQILQLSLHENSTISKSGSKLLWFRKLYYFHSANQKPLFHCLARLATIWQNRPMKCYQKANLYRRRCLYYLENSLISKWGYYLEYHNST